MKTVPVVLRSFLAAACVFAAALNRIHGQTELYAGPSENRFSLLRDSASTTGYEFGGTYGILSWLAIDVGYSDFGTVSSAFPIVVANPPEINLDTFIPTTGTNSLHVDARAIYLLPELSCSFGHLLSGSLGVGLATLETKVGSNLYYQTGIVSVVGGPPPLPPWLPTYSETRRSWTGLGRAGLRAAVSRSWMAEASAHFISAPAIGPAYPPFAEIGNRRLRVFGVALDLIWRLPAR